MEVGEGRGHAVGGEGHAVVAGGSGDDGSAYADVGRDAGGDKVGDAVDSIFEFKDKRRR